MDGDGGRTERTGVGPGGARGLSRARGLEGEDGEKVIYIEKCFESAVHDGGTTNMCLGRGLFKVRVQV
jgi:hypothetical protein